MMTPEEIHIRVGKNLRNLRSCYGMSRKTLAKLIKMPVSRLRRVEAGDARAGIYDFHLQRTARVFGITVEALLDADFTPDTT